MSFASEKNAGHLLTSLYFGSSEWKGAQGGSVDVQIVRDPKRSNGHLTAYDNSVIAIGAMGSVRCLDLNSVKAYNASPANFIANLVDGAGNAGAVTTGPMVPGSYRRVFEIGQGGMPLEQEVVHEGTSLTDTDTL
mgnify:CR=1 FL=1